jgi:hypothetical protein
VVTPPLGKMCRRSKRSPPKLPMGYGAASAELKRMVSIGIRRSGIYGLSLINEC